MPVGNFAQSVLGQTPPGVLFKALTDAYIRSQQEKAQQPLPQALGPAVPQAPQGAPQGAPQIQIDPIRIMKNYYQSAWQHTPMGVAQGLLRGNPPQPAPEAVPQGPQAAPQVPQMPQGQQAGPSGPSPFREFLAQVGLPLGAAIAGLVSPGMLPGAAGFATGFPEGMRRTKELRAKEAEDRKRPKPSPESLYRMAQSEAFRMMGGGMLGSAKMANEKGKEEYNALVEKIYQQYLQRFLLEDAALDMDTEAEDLSKINLNEYEVVKE